MHRPTYTSSIISWHPGAETKTPKSIDYT